VHVSALCLQELKLQALVQLKALRLRHKQQQLRQELLVEKWLQEDTHPHMLMDWGRLQRGDSDPVAVAQQQLPLARPQQLQQQLGLGAGGAERQKQQQVQQQVAEGRGRAVFRVLAPKALPQGVMTEDERVAYAQR
jgi:hypothetical protein